MAVNIGTVIALANGIANKVANANFQGLSFKSSDDTSTTYSIDFLLNGIVTSYDLVLPNGTAGKDGVNVTNVNFIGNDLVFTLSDSSLITLTNAKLDLKGDKGEQGTQGIQGINGKEIELQKGSTYIQWRYVGETSWRNLIAISEITEVDGTFDSTTPFPELITTSKTVIGAINENTSSIAEITQEWLGNKKLIYVTLEQFNSLTTVEQNDETKVYNIIDETLQLPTTNKTFSGSINEIYNVVIELQNRVYQLENGGSGVTKYVVMNNLTKIINSNLITEINSGDNYTATLTANEGYTISNVTITMNGTDITSSAYSDGVISINNVIGNIVIVAGATSNSGGINIDYSNGTVEYKYLSLSGVAVSDQVGTFMDASLVDYIAINGGETVKINSSLTYNSTRKYTVCEYDSSQKFIKRTKDIQLSLDEYLTVNTSVDARFIRVGIAGSVDYTKAQMDYDFNKLSLLIDDVKITLPTLV